MTIYSDEVLALAMRVLSTRDYGAEELGGVRFKRAFSSDTPNDIARVLMVDIKWREIIAEALLMYASEIGNEQA